jgi:hypothetical protein
VFKLNNTHNINVFFPYKYKKYVYIGVSLRRILYGGRGTESGGRSGF